jgi:hypothetical protein
LYYDYEHRYAITTAIYHFIFDWIVDLTYLEPNAAYKFQRGGNSLGLWVSSKKGRARLQIDWKIPYLLGENTILVPVNSPTAAAAVRTNERYENTIIYIIT